VTRQFWCRAGVIALVGAFNYLVILGKVEPLAVTVRAAG
jgi:hypothetical protein